MMTMMNVNTMNLAAALAEDVGVPALRNPKTSGMRTARKGLIRSLVNLVTGKR